MKRCSKCGHEKPSTPEYFVRHRGFKNGLNSWCKDCSREIDRVRYKKNPEPAKRRASMWATANPDRRRAVNKAWTASHPERVRGYKRRWQHENREEYNNAHRMAQHIDPAKTSADGRKYKLK